MEDFMPFFFGALFSAEILHLLVLLLGLFQGCPESLSSFEERENGL